jgi:chromosome segregation ATPase
LKEDKEETSMNLSGKKLTTAILAGLMGATMFGSSVFADDAQRLTNVEVLATQNKSNIDILKNDVQALKGASTKDTYSKDEVDNKLADKANQSDVTTNTNGIATNKQAISDEAKDRQTADADLQKGVDANKTAISDEKTARQDADTKLQASVDANKTAISDEKTARQDADTKLQASVDANKTAISDEATARQTADADLQKGVDANKQAISDEATARQTADADLQKGVDANKQAISDEATARQTADADLQKGVDANKQAIADETTARQTDVAKLQTNIQKNGEAVAKVQEDYTTVKGTVQFIKDNKYAIDNVNTMKTQLDATTAVADNNHTAIQKEISDRQAANDQLKSDMGSIQGQQDEQNNKIDDHEKRITANEGRITDLQTGVDANKQAISDEAKARQTADADLQKGVDTNKQAISDEETARKTADVDLQKGVDANKQAISDEATARKTADADLQKGVDANKQAISDEATARQTADADLQKGVDVNKTAISDEKTARQDADTKLQASVDANKTAISDEKTARQDADTKLQASVDANKTVISDEKTARQDADLKLQHQIDNNSTSINDLYGRYSSLKTDINKVGARSAALAGLHPLDFDPANKLNFAVASGSFKGENSVALGAFYRPNENIMFSAASTMGDSDNAYTFGLSFKIGPSSAKTKTTSPDAEELYKVVGELQDQLAAQQKEIEQLKADKAK